MKQIRTNAPLARSSLVQRKPLKLKYSIKNAAEFQRLVKALSDDIVDAHIHFRLHEDLVDVLAANPLVEPQSPTFWSSTLQGHLNSSLYALFRAYDQDTGALHLPSWLTIIEENLSLFTRASFRDRLKNNVHVATLAKATRKPNAARLAKDILVCTTADPIVKKLITYRSNWIAHRNATIAIGTRGAGYQSGLTYADLRVLLRRSKEILNRYSNLFSANIYATTVVGRDDYQYLVESVQNRVEESRRQWHGSEGR